MLLADHQLSTDATVVSKADAAAPATFKNALVGIDGTSAGRDAIALGERLRDADGHLTLAHVVLVERPAYGNLHSTNAGRRSRAVARARARRYAGAGRAHRDVRAGGRLGPSPVGRDAGADLLVVGSCARRPIARLLRGDDTRSTLTRAPCAVAVAPRGYARRPRPIETIGVAYDGSPQAELAVVTARVLAARHRAALHAVTAVWPTGAMTPPASRLPLFGAWWGMMLDAYEHEARERLRALTGTDGTVLVGPPEDELRKFSERVDLLVVGSRGHGRLRRLLLGSTSAALARRVRCPLLVLTGQRATAQSRSR